jgi:lysophospholipase L1-like esterase
MQIIRWTWPTWCIAAALVIALIGDAPAQVLTTPATQPATQPARRGGPGRVGGRAPTPVSPRDSQPMTPGSFASVNASLPTLVIAGDSTAETGNASTRGWGALLVDYFDTSKINLVNLSRGGRSSRTFLREGLWDQLLAGLKPGDYVMLQFGHNDGGTPERRDVPGKGDETENYTGRDGKIEVVHTFSWYTRKFIKDVRDKGAIPVVMAATPYNRWTDGKFQHRPGDFAVDAKAVAEELKAPFMDHTEIIGARYDVLGEQTVRGFFTADGILHTNTPGAIVNAEAFVAGVKAMGIKPLVEALSDKGKSIPAYTASATP